MSRFYTLSLILLFHLLCEIRVAAVTDKNSLSENYTSEASYPRVLFIGNSILAPVYNLFVSDGEPYECTSVAFPGATISDQVDAWNGLTVDQKKSFDFILVEVGINNVFPGAESYLSLYQDMIDLLNEQKSEGCIIIAATLTPSKGSENVGFNNWLALNAAIRGEGSNPITGIDVVMTTNTTRLDLNGDYYMDAAYDRGDGVHPNSAGQQVIKNNFLEALGNIPVDPPDPPDPPVDTTDPGDPPDPPDTTVVLDPPQAPSSMEAEYGAEKKMILTWKDHSNNESGFVITKSLLSNPVQLFQINVNANDTAFLDSDIKAGTTYTYKIKAVNADGSSGYSNIAIAAVPSASELKRTRDGLIAFYNFAYNSEYIMYDVSGNGVPLNLKPSATASLNWQNNELILDHSVPLSSAPAEKIMDAVAGSNEITVECWIKPSEPENSASGRIISLGKSEDNIGFVLEQNYLSGSGEKLLTYSARLSTSSTVSSGMPVLSQQEGGTTHISMHNVVFTRDSSGNEYIYVDGRLTAEGFRPGKLDVWDHDLRLFMGNSLNGDHPWNGSIYMLAVYNRSLSHNEVNKNFNAGPHEGVVKSSMNYDLEIGPNPAFTDINLKISASEVPDIIISSALIRIIDINGNVLYHEELFSPALELYKTLDVSTLNPGIYFLQVISGTNLQTSKFVKN